MDNKIIILSGIGVIVTSLIYLGLQNSLRVPTLFSTPISSKEAITTVAHTENLTRYNVNNHIYFVDSATAEVISERK
jgi:hypothetical protein